MKIVNRGYTGIPTFLRQRFASDPADYGSATIGVLGVPFDEGSPFLPGSRFGPRGIREHSLRIPVDAPLYDPDVQETYLGTELAQGHIVDLGDIDIRPANPARTFELITAKVREMLDAGLFPVILGGDHAITYPVFAAFDRPVHVVQFDAHQDYAEIDEDLNRTNSHAFRYITQMDTCLSLTQVGIRGLRTTKDHVDTLRAKGHRVICMTEARSLGPAGLAALLPEGSDIYVTIDVDALDLSIVPGCVSGEPDGLSFRQLMESLKALAQRHRIVGFDFVEVNPPLDIGTGATSYLGALIVTGFLGHICNQPWWAARSDAA
ncbi:arginase family protein [Actibacterium ureilyticum]|uniref:arginase family protein n=1 Tax=Actibacterium ureilyticum TaxID=1590614 RepID=UPI000BAAF8F4|nr:arginase family protein [Actibacterium ureilyticum]